MSEVQTPAAQATPTPPAQTEAKTETPAVAASAPAANSESAQSQSTSEAQTKPSVVPDKYDLKLPEGSTLDPKALESVSAFAKENGLSQEAAQAVLEREHSLVKGLQKAQTQEWEATKERWLKESMSDKELGGDRLKESVEIASRAIKRFDPTGKMTEMLEKSGFGNHPEVIRFMKRIGEAMAEDRLVVPGAQVGSGKKPIEEIFYPSKQ